MLAQPPVARRPWLGRPLQLSLVAVAVVAILAAAVFVSQRPQVGPPPAGSPEPTSTIEASPSPTTEASTALPSASVVVPSPNSTTSTSTPLPTGISGMGWTGLSWSDGVALPSTDTSRLVINDILRWGSGYVGAGFKVTHDPVADTDTGIAPAFLTSHNGRNWTISQIGPPRQVEDTLDVRLAMAGHALVAIERDSLRLGGAPLLWQSDDGLAWTPIDSPTWRAAWEAGGHRALLGAVASGPEGIVAIGGLHADWGDPESLPVIVHSVDGVTWERIAVSSAFADAYLYDVATSAGGFVIVGRTGQPDPPAGTGAGRPAAWVSTDGRTWVKANVPGDSGPRETLADGSSGLGPRLSQVVAGADGLFALGLRAGATGTYCCDPTSGWASADGRTWTFVGDLGGKLPYVDALAGDGSHMVLFGHTSGKDVAVLGWSSTDGVTWTRLAFSGSTAIPGRWNSADESGPYVLAHEDPVHVVPAGLVVAGLPSAGQGELLWFATATAP